MQFVEVLDLINGRFDQQILAAVAQLFLVGAFEVGARHTVVQRKWRRHYVAHHQELVLGDCYIRATEGRKNGAVPASRKHLVAHHQVAEHLGVAVNEREQGVAGEACCAGRRGLRL
jgi:hypothetical protein